MVKRKAAAKKTAAKKPPARAAKKAKTNGARKPKPPKNEQLELIKGARYADLDRLCRQIGDVRDEINDLKANGAAFEQSALRAMRVHNVTGYNYAGTTLTRNQGDETLTVKRDRKKSASEGTGAMNQPLTGSGGAQGDSDVGTGQDAGNIAENLTEGTGDEG